MVDKDKPQITQRDRGQGSWSRLDGKPLASPPMEEPAFISVAEAINGAVNIYDSSLRDELERAHEQHNPTMEDIEQKPHQEARIPGTAHSGIDGAVLAVSELLFLLFGLPFGDALYHGNLTAIHWVYLAIALVCAIAGPMWPAIRNRWASPDLSASVAAAARDVRLWIALLLILFLYGVAPEIYQRATKPIAVTGAIGVMPIGTTSVDDAVAQATKKITAERDEAIKSASRTAKERDDLTKERDAALSDTARLMGQLRMQPISPSPISQKPVSWFADSQLFVASGGPPNGSQVHGILIMGESTATAAIKEAYLVSGLTGHKQSLKANVHSVGAYFPVDKVDIPAGAPVQLDLIFNPPIPLKDFMDQWARFRFTVVYSDGTTYEREYDETYVRQKMQQVVPEAFGPRMTPREDK
jgi:hypothetical protein